MTNFEENWYMHFVPECYFDTVLLRRLLQTNKRLMHRRGCNNVILDLNSSRLKDSFAVGIVDKDKRDSDYFKECKVLYDSDKVILRKHNERLQFVIQLNPPLENWIVSILDENGLRIEDFGYERNFKKLKQQIKDDIDHERDDKLNRLVSAIIKTDCETIKKIKLMLLYLKEHNFHTKETELVKCLKK